MQRHDLTLVEAGDLGTALRLMTSLPVPSPAPSPAPVTEFTGEFETPQRDLMSVWAWPLAGLVIALIAALVGILLRKLDMGAGLAAAGVLLTLTALTGARHEAALARAVRALFAQGASPASAEPAAVPRQDDQTAAQMTVLLITLARWSALSSLLASGHGLAPILAAAVLSRAALPVLMVALKPADSEHPALLESMAPPRASAALALVIALTLALFCLGWALIPAVAGAGVVAVALGLAAHLLMKGRSTDMIQGAQPMLELGVLAALLAAL